MTAERRVACIAHRGGAREAPEGTLRAFRRAADLGCDALELDLRATADGVVVVLHDPEVERVTDGSGPVASLTLAQVRRLDAAHWFAADRGPDHDAGPYPLRGSGADDLRIPTLDELLAAVPGIPLVLDLKVGPPEQPEVPERVAALLAAHARSGDVIVGSFEQERLDAFRRVAPGVPTSATTQEVTALWSGGALPDVPGFRAVQVPVRYGAVEVVTPELVAAAHAGGAEVHVWTVDEPDEMRRLVALGVDAIITDRPSTALAVLRG